MKETEKSLRLPHRQALYESLTGLGLDIGSGNNPLVLPGRTIHTFDQMPGCTFQGDAQTLEGLVDESYDFVHSSHTLEHMRDVTIALHHWRRVLKPNRLLIVTVPDHHFYERGIWPSPFNGDHKQRFSVLPLPDDQCCWSVGRLVSLAHSLGLHTTEVFLELDRFDFAQHASRFLVDQTMADATAQVCFVFRKMDAI